MGRVSIKEFSENYKEVIVSPRVRNIPYHYGVSLIVHFFIIFTAVGAAFLYTALATTTNCQAIPLGEKVDSPGLECGVLQLRRDTSAFAETQAIIGDAAISFTVAIGLQLFITDQRFLSTDFSELAVDAQLFQTLQLAVETEVANELTRVTSPEEILRFYQEGGLEEYFLVNVSGLVEERVDLDFEGGQGNANRINNGNGNTNNGNASNGNGNGNGIGTNCTGPVNICNDAENNSTDTDSFSMFVQWSTANSDINCILQNNFDGLNNARNVVNCQSKQVISDGTPVFQLIWISEGYVADSRGFLLVDLLAFFQSIHGVPLSSISSITNSQTLLKNTFAQNFFSCCLLDQLDTIEYFGIVSGILFLLEGIFAFIVAYCLFNGRLKNQKAPSVLKNPLLFSYSMTFFRDLGGIDPVEGEFDNELEDEDKLEDGEDGLGVESTENSSTKLGTEGTSRHDFDSGMKAKEVHEIERRDLLRVVFNPRCRYIPFASTVSFLSLVVLIGLSVVLALWYQQLQTVTLCEPQAISDIGQKSDCEDVNIESFVYETAVIGTVTTIDIPVGVVSSLFIESTTLASFDIMEVFLNQDFVNDVVSACTGVTVEVCVDGMISLGSGFGVSTGNFSLTARNSSTSRIGFVSFVNETALGEELVRASLKVDLEQILNGTDATDEDVALFEELSVEYRYERIDTFGNALVNLGASYSTTFATGPEKLLNFSADASELIATFVDNVVSADGNPVLIRNPFASGFTQCCRQASLEYYDYLGLVMGFVALGEGVLTLFVAVAFYFVLRVYEIFEGYDRKEKEMMILE